MKSLSLRWRIIIALIALAAGTSLVLSLLARSYLERSLRVSINPEMERALADALNLAKENYDGRKSAMAEAGLQLAGSRILRDAYRAGDLGALQGFLAQQGLEDISLRLVAPPEDLPVALPGNLSEGPYVLKDPERENLLQLIVPIREDGRVVAALMATERLDKLLNVERANQTYEHLQMIEEDLHRGFLLAFLAAAAGVVLLASLIGIRIGFETTHPLYDLIKGTRELARDNLDYRVSRGRDDEIGQLIDSFNRMAEDLKQNRQRRVEAEKVAAWREIARRLAHEIKNPLTPIQLTVQQMRDKYPGGDPAYRKLVEDCTEIVIEEVESLRVLVQEFADFARMPSLSLSPQDLNSVVLDAARLYPEARVETDLDPDLPELELDIEQIHRVLINLIENGVEAAGENGVLTLRTHVQDDTARLQVIDSGPGVPEVDRERIFEPYISTKQSGMGLGLAVVRSVVENHGGQIFVTEGPTGGAQFEILLPIPEAVPTQPEVQAWQNNRC